MELLFNLNNNKMFIDGKWVQSPIQKQFEVKNPATGQLVGKYELGNRETATNALMTAHKMQKELAELPARQRAGYLNAIAHELLTHQEQLAKILTMENGKPIRESFGEVGAAAAHFEWFAEEGCRVYGRIVPPTNTRKRHLVIKQPVGVSACISPWNFPLVLWARKVAPALAAGCTVVARPSSRTTLVAIAAMKLIEKVGLPDGILNLVTGPAAEVVGEFISNSLCRKISFTGSTEIGRELMKQGADQIKHLSLELGGHAPAIVFEDAELDVAVKSVLGAKYRNGGQSCIAINRIYVQEGIIEQFTKRFVDSVKKLKIGNGLDPETDLGPMIDESSLNKFLRHVNDAVNEGGELLFGGKRLTDSEYAKGFFVSPAVITNVKDEMLCMQAETFGPLAAITSFRTVEEVVEKANATIYGLSAYLYTTNLKTAFIVGEQLEAGTIGINDDVPSTTIAPFGGMKQSGLGRECGQEGLEAFLETKHISIIL